MKTLSRKSFILVLAIIAIVTFVSCLSTSTTNYTYEKVIGNPTAVPPVYRGFKKGADDDSDFRAALIALKRRRGACEITILHPGPHQTPQHGYCLHLPVNLKTDRVIKTKAAKKTAAGESAANDPNVTWRVQSNYEGDITKVIDTLAP